MAGRVEDSAQHTITIGYTVGKARSLSNLINFDHGREARTLRRGFALSSHLRRLGELYALHVHNYPESRAQGLVAGHLRIVYSQHCTTRYGSVHQGIPRVVWGHIGRIPTMVLPGGHIGRYTHHGTTLGIHHLVYTTMVPPSWVYNTWYTPTMVPPWVYITYYTPTIVHPWVYTTCYTPGYTSGLNLFHTRVYLRVKPVPHPGIPRG